ncbi:ABC transporter substrate-binding protein [Nocardioides sp. CCNWLW239]|uniref:ABC transporter substrate-binding protein n=1 Tax=Nocardioides sp. CCNWLW239 TaxID=3128902 RepID=UPI003018B28A
MSSLAACGREASDEAGLKQITIAVGIDSTYASFFVADAKGFFKEQGLDVDVVQFGSGGEAVQAIAGNQAQFAGASPMTGTSLQAQNPDLRGLATYMSSDKYTKIVANTDVNGPADVKKFGVVPGLSLYMAHKYLEANGIDPDSVKYVESSPAELPALTKKGDIDAYALWEPWPTNGEKMGLKILTDTGGFGQPSSQVLMTDSTYLAENNAVAVDVVEALDEASAYIQDDPDDAASIVSDATKLDEGDVSDALGLIEFGSAGFTDTDYVAYEQQAQFFVDTGVLKSVPEMRSYYLPDWYAQNIKTAQSAG